MIGRAKISHIGLDTFGDWVRTSREDIGMSQTELAELIGVHQITISNIETGKTIPSWQTMDALAIVFDCDIKVAMIKKREPSREWVKGGIGRYK